MDNSTTLHTHQKGTKNVELYPEINEKLTIKRVNKFLTDDLEKLLLMSGHNLTSLRSPKLDFTNSHTNNGNGVENNIIRGLDAESRVMAIHKAINSLPDLSKTIITDTYIVQMSAWQVAQATGYSHTRYHELKNKALVQFADSFGYWQGAYNCRPHIDLHIYK